MSRWAKVRAVWVAGGVVALALAGVPSRAELQIGAATAKKPKVTGKGAAVSKKKTPGVAGAAKSGTSKGSSAKGSVKGGKGKLATKKGAAALAKGPSPQVMKLTNAFTASAQLRPMAQQLASTRSLAAYSGVQSYARMHPGEGAAAAYLALGHAYMLDHRYGDAAGMYREAGLSGDALDDYADYLGAQAALQAGHGADAYGMLDHFADRHPGSIFVANAPVLLANAYIQQGNPQGALQVLQPLGGTDLAGHNDFRYTLARAYQVAGDTGKAAPIYRGLYTTQPLSFEAAQSRTQMQAMAVQLTAAERKVHADQLFNAKHYSEAADEFHAIEKNDSSLSEADRGALRIYAAVCDLKLKHLSRRDVEKLPDTADDSAALKLYMLAEISRTEKKETEHDAILEQMVKRFPASRWLEEALYSGGNMYLIKHDSKQAIYHYKLLVELFPKSTYGPSAHWRAAWMNYRLRNYAEAARLMDEQIQRYGGGIEIPSALYWRGRIYEDEERNFGQAIDYYRTLTTAYTNYYYGQLGRQRLKVLSGQAAVAPSSVLNAVRRPAVPVLTGELPEDEPHLIKARLLANAALNEYIAPEIQASSTGTQWGALAQAEIFVSYGETTRALQSMKRSGIAFFALPMDQVPTIYWKLLFPQPYWSDLTANAQRNGLDPYLVASLIRQESEFNAGVVSHANAYGLMQLLPSVGKAMAKKQGIKGFNAGMLLNPATNLQLGTANLRTVLDRFGGQVEYALAAYNAGDVPIRQWMSSGDYKDIPEFVESIPYTETREYVQAIVRNREMYRALYPAR